MPLRGKLPASEPERIIIRKSKQPMPQLGGVMLFTGSRLSMEGCACVDAFVVASCPHHPPARHATSAGTGVSMHATRNGLAALAVRESDYSIDKVCLKVLHMHMFR